MDNLSKENKFPQIETKLEVKNEAGSDKAKLYLSGTIRKAFPWEDEDACISASRVNKELDKLNNKDVEIRLNSGGGDVFESIEICNNLKDYEGNIDIVVTSRAGSGASLITTAGRVSMYINSVQMVHKATTGTWGNADDFRKTAVDLDQIDKAVKASYKKKFVGTDAELVDLIAEGSWLTAEECLALGFCDEILDAEDEEEEESTENNVSKKIFSINIRKT